MFELSEKQLQELQEPEPVAVNPETREEFVLVRRDVYQQMKSLINGSLDIREAYPVLDEMAAKAGWDDPAMDIYNDFAKKP